jgi:hypothetical protein
VKIEAMLRLFLSLLAAGALLRPLSAGATAPILDLSLADATMSADMDDRPLDEVLRLMADRGLIEVKGRIPGGEPLTLHFRRLTLDQALSRIMRGYNYVVIEQGKARAPLLTVMGKVERGSPGASRATEAPPALPAEPDSRSYVPPVHPEPPKIPIGKDGQPVPHWIDDDMRVHLTGAPETPEKTQATEAGRKQANEQPTDAAATGVSAQNQASDPTPQGTAAAPPDQPSSAESPGVRF